MNSKSHESNKFRDYSSLFCRQNVLQWLGGNLDSINFKISRYDASWLDRKNATYLEYLRHVYYSISSRYRTEYIYKNDLINSVLFDEINSDNSNIYSEFKMNSAIADLAIFNGISKVFEIKTEFDNAKRLGNQLKSYAEIFNEIYLVIPQEKLRSYKVKNPDIGIILFSNEMNNSFEIERKATPNFNINPNKVMQLLHTKEYKSIVKKYKGFLPKMNSFNQFDICKEQIQSIPCDQLNLLFIDELKKRKEKVKISKRYYKEFNQLFISLNLGVDEKKHLIKNLNSEIPT